MSEQNNIYSNAVLSSTLDGMYRGLSGLYDVAVTHKAKIAQQIAAREAGDLALSTALSTAVKNITDSLTEADTAVGTLSTALSTAIDAEAGARETGDAQALSSAKKYTDDKLVDYYTSAQVDVISAAVEQAYKAADSGLSSAIDAINAKTISGTNAIAASTVDGATTISLNLNATSAILSQDASGLKTTISLQKITTGLADNIESEYALVGLNGVELGERIQVTKDRFLQGVEYVPSTQILNFSFKLADGTTQVSPVDIGSLVDTYTAGNGVDITNNVVTVKKDSTSEDFLKVTSAGVAITGVSAAIADAVAPVDTRVQAIESAIPVASVTSGAILVEKAGKIVLNDNYNPGIALQFNGKSVGAGITSLNFAGTTTITVGDDGVAKVQIGENMNTSVWNAQDGKQGDGTVSGFPDGSDVIVPSVNGSTTATFNVGNWTAGTTVKGITTSTVSVKSTGNIHLDEGINTWNIKVYGATGNVVAEANVNDIVTYNNQTNPTSATVTASAVDYVTGTQGITHTIDNGALEDNYPAAVGGRAQVTFTFDLTKIDEVKNGGRFSIEISGCGGTYKSAERFYIKETSPTIASATLTFNNDESTRKVSGVEYITAGTYTIETGNITNLNNQAAVSTKVAITATSDFSDEDTAVTATELTNYTNAWDNVCTYKDAGLTLGSSVAKKGTAVSITLTPKNAKGSGTAVSASVSGLNINTYASTNSTDAVESFLAENRRLKEADLSAWDSALILGLKDLQVIPGEGLVYPTTNYSGFTPAGPNYSGLSGERYFVRKMTVNENKTVFGGTLTFDNKPTWADITFAKLSIDNGTTWFNLKADRGGADPLGIYNSYTNGVVSFTFPGTTSMTASSGVIIKLGWSKTTTKITKITLAM